jgi:hypothetical protein
MLALTAGLPEQVEPRPSHEAADARCECRFGSFLREIAKGPKAPDGLTADIGTEPKWALMILTCTSACRTVDARRVP